MYPQETIQEVRFRNDIVNIISSYVNLKSRGARHIGLCPFHQEKTPSFHVNSDLQLFHCFGCGASGNVISFIMRIENLDFIETLKLLADRAGYILPNTKFDKEKHLRKEHLLEINKKAAILYHEELINSKIAMDYLLSRGINIATIKRFGLGFSTSLINKFELKDLIELGLVYDSGKDVFQERIMFPIIDIRNKVVGFGGRILPDKQDKRKYINSPETMLFSKSNQLYGINLARKAYSKSIIIVEGYLDVISMNQAGYKNTIAVLGTALTPEHVRLLKRIACESVYLFLDKDKAGINATLRAIPVLTDGGLNVKVIQTDAKDPDELIHGNGKLELETAISHIAFQVRELKNKYNLNQTDERISFTKEAALLLTNINSSIELDAYISEIAKISGIRHEAILNEIQSKPPSEPVEINKPIKLHQEDAGLKEAKKGLLKLALTDEYALNIIKEHITADEFNNQEYKSFFELAIKNANNIPAPVDLISYFDTIQMQQKITEVLQSDIEYSHELEKAIKQMIFKVKMSYFQQKTLEGHIDLQEKKKIYDLLRSDTIERF